MTCHEIHPQANVNRKFDMLSFSCFKKNYKTVYTGIFDGDRSYIESATHLKSRTAFIGFVIDRLFTRQ